MTPDQIKNLEIHLYQDTQGSRQWGVSLSLTEANGNSIPLIETPAIHTFQAAKSYANKITKCGSLRL